MRFVRFGLLAVALAVVGCAPDYSPNVYTPNAVQQANKVLRGTVVGYRQVEIQSDGTVGAVAGGAAGGILGAQAGDTNVAHALAGVGGALAGGLVGTAVEHTTGDTTGWEYIVQEDKGDLVSVTQRQPKPIAVGQHVLVIEGKQARIIPDYAVASTSPPQAPPKTSSAPPANAPTNASATGAVTAASVPLSPAAPAATSAPTPIAPASAPAASPPSSASSPPPPIPAAAFVSTAPCRWRHRRATAPRRRNRPARSRRNPSPSAPPRASAATARR